MTIADLALRGYTYKQIAEQLGMSTWKVQHEAEIAKAEWAEKRQAFVHSKAARDFALSDALLQALLDRALDCSDPIQNFTVDRVIALMDYRAKLTGQYNTKPEHDLASVLGDIFTRMGITEPDVTATDDREDRDDSPGEPHDAEPV